MMGVVVAMTAGCARPVAVDAPPRSDECAETLASTPIRILGELQRETSPADVSAVVWGDPPIVLVCGIDSSIPADAQVINVNGIDWVAQTSTEGTVFTTFDRSPTLQMRVPSAYRPEAEALTELALSD